MSYHYSREPGEQGTIHTVDGAAQGVALAILFQSGRPPLRACLQLGSAIADILTIAEEDRAVHGDIKPEDVTVLANGAVALGGFGNSRSSTRAPEDRPEGPLTDVFGLGVVLHSLLSNKPLSMLPRDPDAHDSAVVKRVMEMDFGGLEGKRWMDDARRFLCSVMAYDPQERPAPLDAANVLARIAEQAPGTDLETWAAKTLRQQGAPVTTPQEEPEEALGGPRSLSAPMPRGQALETRQAPASKGQTTQMWTRERLAAFIDEDDEDDEMDREPPARPPAAPPQEQLPGPTPARPISGGWGKDQPSLSWNPADLPAQPQARSPEPIARPNTGRRGEPLPGLEPPPAAPERAQVVGASELPRHDPPPPQQGPPPPPPQQGPPPPPPPPQQGPPPPPPPARPPAPPRARPPAPPPAPPRPPPLSAPARPAAAPSPPPKPESPRGRPPTGRQPGRVTSAAATPAPPPIAWSPEAEAAEEKTSSSLPYMLIAAAVFFFLCLGIPAITALAYAITADKTERGAPIVQTTGEDPAERGRDPVVQDTASGADKPEPLPTQEPEPAPAPTPVTKAPTRVENTTKTSSSSSGGGTSKTTRVSKTPEPEPEPEPAAVVLPGAGYEVKISLPSKKRASIRCGDGQSSKFSSAVRMDFKGTVTCVLEADGARGAVTMTSGGHMRCGITSEDIFCSGPS